METTMVRNKQQLDKYFKQFKEKKEREKEKKKQLAKQKQKQYQAEYRKLGKEKAENDAKQLIEKLKLLNPPKPIDDEEYYTQSSRWIERFTAEEDLYNEHELRNIETLHPEETGRINWEFFEKLREKTRKEIDELLKHRK